MDLHSILSLEGIYSRRALVTGLLPGPRSLFVIAGRKVQSSLVLLPLQSAFESMEGLDYFAVDLTRAYVDLLIRQIQLVRDFKRRDPQVFEVSFQDNAGEFYAGDPSGHSASRPPEAVEACYVLVNEHGVSWEAIPLHSEGHVSTPPISLEELQSLRDHNPPQAPPSRSPS